MFKWSLFFKRKAPASIRIVRFILLLTLFVFGFAVLTAQPSGAVGEPTKQTLDPERLRGHVVMLSESFAPRNYKRIWNLNKCADYIAQQFNAAGADVSEQTYDVKGRTYRNVIANFGPNTDSRIVIGAHYDSYQDTPGADDNASGTAGLIELARLFGQTELRQRVDLVAFTLEEPPFFRTGNMGSARHASALRKEGVEVELMVCLEMIGYFSDEPGSQVFPSAMLQLVYPDTGNYIAVIGSMSESRQARFFKQIMRGATDLPVESMCAPRNFPGLDFSDHLSYWSNGYKALMITDTAFMRNGRYHGSADTADTLDYDRMAKVVLGVYEAVMEMTRN
jgi:hypothetical protein